jgi:hypothetical protein
MPAGENTCGVESSGAGEIGISSWARAVAEGLLLMEDRCCHALGCLGTM